VATYSFLVHDLSSVCNRSTRTGTTCAAGTAYPTRAPEFTPGFSGFVLLDL